MSLAGKRTYVVAVGIVLSALGAYMTGEMSLLLAINSAMIGLGFTTIRLSIPPTKGIR